MEKINTIERYEILARVFERMTGYMAPGKDSRCCGHSIEERSIAWQNWLDANERFVSATLDAVEYVLSVDEE